MTLKIAIVGCGSIARRAHVPAFTQSSDADVVAFVSRTRTSAEAAATECGVTPDEAARRVYDDWREVVALDGLDAVDICSPNVFHAEQAIAAARAGKHVLVEKPIASSLDDADAMIEAAAKAGVVLQVAHNLRYIPAVLAAHDVVRAGRLGNIVGLRAAFGHAGPRHWAPDSTWFFDQSLSGGGALIDLGIHIIDVVGFVTGLVGGEVTAMTYGKEPCEDAAHLVVRFANDAVGTISASWVARPAPDMLLTIFGTEGTLHFDARSPLTFRSAAGEKEEVELPEVTANPFDDFARVVTGHEPLGPAASGEEGRAALAIVDAAYASAKSGKTATVR